MQDGAQRRPRCRVEWIDVDLGASGSQVNLERVSEAGLPAISAKSRVRLADKNIQRTELLQARKAQRLNRLREGRSVASQVQFRHSVFPVLALKRICGITRCSNHLDTRRQAGQV